MIKWLKGKGMRLVCISKTVVLINIQLKSNMSREPLPLIILYREIQTKSNIKRKMLLEVHLSASKNSSEIVFELLLRELKRKHM
jgi:hypothetical protein